MNKTIKKNEGHKVIGEQFQKLINSSLENYSTEQIKKNIKFYEPLINEGILYISWLDKLNDELRKREVSYK
jgi:hypothetical protein